jgi:hypothetical protein
MSIEVLKSATVSSEKIQQAGFIFQYPTWDQQLANWRAKKIFRANVCMIIMPHICKFSKHALPSLKSSDEDLMLQCLPSFTFLYIGCIVPPVTPAGFEGSY